MTDALPDGGKHRLPQLHESLRWAAHEIEQANARLERLRADGASERRLSEARAELEQRKEQLRTFEAALND